MLKFVLIQIRKLQKIKFKVQFSIKVYIYIGNIDRYPRKNNSLYSIVSRVGNTVAYSKGTVNDMEEIGKIFEDLGF